MGAPQDARCPEWLGVTRSLGAGVSCRVAVALLCALCRAAVDRASGRRGGRRRRGRRVRLSSRIRGEAALSTAQKQWQARRGDIRRTERRRAPHCTNILYALRTHFVIRSRVLCSSASSAGCWPTTAQCQSLLLSTRCSHGETAHMRHPAALWLAADIHAIIAQSCDSDA